MKLLLYPLLNHEAAAAAQSMAVGTDYYSAYSLLALKAYIQHHFPTLQVVMELELPKAIRQRPDLILLWSNSLCFNKAKSAAEIFRINVGCPQILAGPHISSLPQTLPEHIDIGLIGEPEATLHQLLPIFLKDPRPTPVKYGRIPGLIYQSRGRIYSGSPAKIIQDLDVLPLPDHGAFYQYPGYWVPLLIPSRGSPGLRQWQIQVPTPKVRYHSARRLAQELQNMATNYQKLYQKWPIPPEFLAYISPVVVMDDQLINQTELFEQLCQEIQARNLHQQLAPIFNVQPQHLTAQTAKQLKAINTQRVMMNFGSFSSRHKEAPTPQQVIQALAHAKAAQIDVISSFTINPFYDTTRREAAFSYWFLERHREQMEGLRVFYQPPLPGSELWTSYQQEHALRAEQLLQFPWEFMNIDQYQPQAPLASKHLDSSLYTQIYQAMTALEKPSRQAAAQAEQHAGPMMKERQRKMLQDGAKAITAYFPADTQNIVEVVVQDNFELGPYLPNYAFRSLRVQQGQLTGKAEKGWADLLVLRHSLEFVREPEQLLQQARAYLKPGGHLLVFYLNSQNVGLLSHIFQWEVNRSTYQNGILRYFTDAHIHALLQKQGFRTLHTSHTIMENAYQYLPNTRKLLTLVNGYKEVPVSLEKMHTLEHIMLAKDRS